MPVKNFIFFCYALFSPLAASQTCLVWGWPQVEPLWSWPRSPVTMTSSHLSSSSFVALLSMSVSPLYLFFNRPFFKGDNLAYHSSIYTSVNTKIKKRISARVLALCMAVDCSIILGYFNRVEPLLMLLTPALFLLWQIKIWAVKKTYCTMHNVLCCGHNENKLLQLQLRCNSCRSCKSFFWRSTNSVISTWCRMSATRSVRSLLRSCIWLLLNCCCHWSIWPSLPCVPRIQWRSAVPTPDSASSKTSPSAESTSNRIHLLRVGVKLRDGIKLGCSIITYYCCCCGFVHKLRLWMLK